MADEGCEGFLQPAAPRDTLRLRMTSLPTPPPLAPPVQPIWPSDLPPIMLDDRGCIAQDIACRSCGYALRGLPPTGVCPECATPVGRSIHGDLLRFCDPKWVERVALGVNILVIAFIVSIVGSILIGAAVIAILAATGTRNVMAFLIPLGIFALATAAANVIGYWLATTRDPGKDESGKPVTARAVARWAIVASSVFSVAAVPFDPTIARFTGASLLADPALQIALSVLSAFAGQGLNALGMVALLMYAGQLARRLPDDRLVKHTRIVMWGYGACSVFIVIGATITAVAGGNPTDPVAIVGSIVTGVGGLPGLVFGIWAIVLLFQFRSRLRLAARQARETWAR